MTTNAPTPSLKYLLCADYGDFTIYCSQVKSYVHCLGAETRTDIHIRPGAVDKSCYWSPRNVTLQNGTFLSGFNWRYTLSADMWGSQMWNNNTHFYAEKPNWTSSIKISVSSDHDLGTNLAVNGILGVPYGWGTINDKHCFLNDDGTLNWEKTRNEYKSHGKRTNFGFDVETTMDGEAWKLKGPVKSGRTLRSGRVLEESKEDTEDFKVSQGKQDVYYANSVKSMLHEACEVAQTIIHSAGIKNEGFLKKLPHARCIAITNNEIKKHLNKKQPVAEGSNSQEKYSPPKREMSNIQEDTSSLLDTIKKQKYLIKEKEAHIRLLERNVELSKQVIAGQRNLIQMYCH